MVRKYSNRQTGKAGNPHVGGSINPGSPRGVTSSANLPATLDDTSPLDNPAVAYQERMRVAAAQASHDRAYRTAPFTKRARLDFLEALAGGMPVFDICVLLGVSRRTVYRQRQTDQDFAREWDEAIEMRYQPVADRLQDIAQYGDPSSMATVRASEILLRVNPAFGAQPKGQRATATLRQTAEGGALTVTLGAPTAD